MLQQMRTFTKSWVANLFLGLIALSFVAWGIGDMFRTRVDTNIVTMGSSQISYEDFSRDYRNVLRNESQRAGHQITPEEARKSGMGQAVFDQVVNRTGLGQSGATAWAHRRRRRRRRARSQDPGLQRPARHLRPQRHVHQICRRSATPSPNSSREIRGDMARDQLLAPVEAGFSVPDGYAHALFTYVDRAARGGIRHRVAAGAGRDRSRRATRCSRPISRRMRTSSARRNTARFRSRCSAATTSRPRSRSATRRSPSSTTPTRPPTSSPRSATCSRSRSRPRRRPRTRAPRSTAAWRSRRPRSQAKITVDDRGTVSKEDLGPAGRRGLRGARRRRHPAGQELRELGAAPRDQDHARQDRRRWNRPRPRSSRSSPTRWSRPSSATSQQCLSRMRARRRRICPTRQRRPACMSSRAAVDAQGLAPRRQAGRGLPADPELVAQIFAADVGEAERSVPSPRPATSMWSRSKA